MNKLEAAFEKEVNENIKTARNLGCAYTAFIKAASTAGALNAAKLWISRQAEDELETLASLNQVRLSIEALVVKGEYAELFSDDEVNACFEKLCGYGYFGG